MNGGNRRPTKSIRSTSRTDVALPRFPPISPEQARDDVAEFCEALRRTVHPSNGGFCGVGNRPTTSNSGEWTTAMNVYVLSTWRPKEYRSVICGAVSWLLGVQRRQGGGWIDIGYDIPGGQSPACTEATTWGILALLRAAGALDPDLRAKATAAVGEATHWLIANQREDGGWGSCAKAPIPLSRTYASAMSIIALLSVRRSKHDVWDEKAESSIDQGITFLHQTKQPIGWGYVPNGVEELPPTSVALSALLMARKDGYERDADPSLDLIASEWRDNVTNGVFELTESTDNIWFTEPIGTKVGSVNVPFAWQDWTLVAGALLSDEMTIQLAYTYIRKYIFPKRNEKFPWLSAMAAYGLMVYLETHP